MTAVSVRLGGVADTFSIDILIRTLFAPFRQISVGPVRGSLDMQLRAIIDKLVSRVIGGIVRTMVLIAGSAVIALASVVGAIYIAVWPLLPLAPFVVLIGVML